MLHSISLLCNFTIADFSTLYTNLPHTAIKDCIFYLIDHCMKNSNQTGVWVSYSSDMVVYKVWYGSYGDVRVVVNLCIVLIVL